ncbi:MAG: radical SAM protein [Pseudomonadota bacterium]
MTKILPKQLQFCNIVMEITKNCNFSCPYCYIEKKNKKKYITYSFRKKIIDALLKHLGNAQLRLQLSGGEILTSKAVYSFIDYLVNNGVCLTYVTNGFNIPDKILTNKKLKVDNNLFSVSVSVDGIDKVHEFTRKSYKSVIGNFEKYFNANISTSIKTTLTKNNFKELEPLLIYLNNLGQRNSCKISHFVHPILHFPKGHRHSTKAAVMKMVLTLEEYMEASAKYHSLIMKKYTHVEPIWFLGFSPGDFQRKMLSFESAFYGCFGGTLLEIDCYGNLRRCELDEPVSIISEECSDDDIIKKVKDILKINVPNSECLKCEYKPVCGMCRQAPLYHGYPKTFGFNGCKEMYDEIKKLSLIYYEKYN